MYEFNRMEITQNPLHQIEYSIIDSCNKNYKACSHFAPLAKQANLVSVEEFIKSTKILHSIIPDIHTFWLIGGEPTLHSKYLEMLKELRKIYNDIPIGIMSNGYGVMAQKDDLSFWKFISETKLYGI